MSRGGLKPEVIIRKQVERAELAQNACRLKAAGLTYRAIAKRLRCSLTIAFRLVHEGIENYNREATRAVGAMIEEMIAQLLISSRELWIEWERSKQDKRRVTKRTGGDKKKPETRDTVEGRLGDPRYLAEFRSNVEMICRLRGVFSDDDEGDVFEEFREEMEESFDPPPEMIEATQQEQISDGDGNANNL